MMKISDFDQDILHAFLLRESRMFSKDEEKQSVFIEKCKTQIKERLAAIEGGSNYIRICSITDMGLVDSELKLTGSPFDHARGDVVAFLPPSFMNPSVNVFREKKTTL
jgi:hypothetical protein